MTTPVAGWQSHSDASDTDNLYETAGNPPSTAPSDGDAVEQWDEETGTDNWTWESSATQSPLYRATGMNSQGCLEFDGVNDALAAYDNAQSTLQQANTFIAASAFTIVAAFTLEEAAGTSTTVWQNEALVSDGSEYWGLHFYTNTGTHYIRGYVYDGATNATPATTNAEISLSTDYVVQFRFGSGTMSLSIDGGTEVTTGSVGNVQDVTQATYLGTGGPTAADINFKIGEIFFYNTDLGASNNTYTYMREKWINESAGPSIPRLMQYYRMRNG